MADPPLAERIRDEREWIGATVEQLAAKLGVEPADVEAWEAGEVELTGDQVESLARVCGLSVERLHGAPLVMDPEMGRLLDRTNATAEDRFQVARFAEFLHHRHVQETEVPR